MSGRDIFLRNRPGTTDVLKDKVVGIAGLGGLGSNIAVHLVRAGVGTLILADFDVVEASNLNRQHYYAHQIGLKKSKALSELLWAINPELILRLWDCVITPDNVLQIFETASVMVEAFDRSENKSMLVNEWVMHKPEVPLVCASGMAGIGPSNEITTQRLGRQLVLVGDLKTQASLEEGLCASRVALAAAHQSHAVIRLLLGMEAM